jgi:acyl-CoA synthetase (AMP-forming)/AMP-acid ligase II
MVTLLVGNPLLPVTDLSSLRLLSCGGSPQSASTIARAIADFGCEFFVSYGMTECCGKISMSILPQGWPQQLQTAAGADEQGAVLQRLLALICTSGRPFLLMEVTRIGMQFLWCCHHGHDCRWWL